MVLHPPRGQGIIMYQGNVASCFRVLGVLGVLGVGPKICIIWLAFGKERVVFSITFLPWLVVLRVYCSIPRSRARPSE